MKKIITSILSILATFMTYSCQFQYYAYEDYIYAINNMEVHMQHVEKSDGGAAVRYTTRNNMVVDFPLSVSVKLVSNKPVILDGSTIIGKKPNILSCSLQYRVLPNGKWITVQKYETPTGSISSAYPPNYYFGRNNIYPQCNPGDVIMIRVYVTDGVWQSGNADNMCTNKLTTVSGVSTKTLPNDLQVTMTHNNKSIDLGGNWSPNLVATVVWSGKTRAIK